MSGQLLMDEEFVAVFPSLIRRTGAASRAIVLQTLWFARDRETAETVMTMDAVADRTGLTKRSVERAIAWLRENDYLDRRRRSVWDATSVWAVNQAALLDPADVAVSITPIGGIDTANVADSHPANVAGSSSKKVEEELPLASTAESHASFVTFWEEYPPRRKTGKAQCFEMWKKMTAAEQALALVALRIDRYRPDWTKQGGEFVPGPMKWLRSQRWKDDDVTAAPTTTKVNTFTAPAPSAFDLVERIGLAGRDYADAIVLAEGYIAAAKDGQFAVTHEGFAAHLAQDPRW